MTKNIHAFHLNDGVRGNGKTKHELWSISIHCGDTYRMGEQNISLKTLSHFPAQTLLQLLKQNTTTDVHYTAIQDDFVHDPST
ncbi:hypothetical protein EUGRSUZ_J01341 [Eucalyptus grandis]|uniref:Uncharacterized protein n=2 Tax=Eucalyptus grandis TaxID=71139 RepID=A0ACC3K0B2_EUCGR|nr:hypothetical protein EUGRSUZ_J01341 [Eucalyptus grandis]